MSYSQGSYQDLMLSEEGRLPITKAGQTGIDYLVEIAEDFRTDNKKFFDNLGNNLNRSASTPIHSSRCL